jgi:chromosome segregation ATPase
LRQEITDLVAARAELTERLAAESKRTEHQRHRAEAAEQQASRATGQVEYLSGELITGREQVEHWQSQVAEQRVELAGFRSELTAARTAIEAEKVHGAQRLADQQIRYEETIGELRVLLRNQHRHINRRAGTQNRCPEPVTRGQIATTERQQRLYSK